MITRALHSTRAAILLALCGTLLAAAACSGSDSPTQPTVNVPYSQTDLVVGTGTEVVNGSRVSVQYSGWLYDASRTDNKGTLFDSGTYTYTVGLGTVITGWEQGVPGMRVGGQRRLVIPPSLGYGSTRNGPIPANSTLVFDITMLNVQ